jgi:hypothetical protein
MARIILDRAATLHTARQRGYEVARPLAGKVLVGARTLVRSGTHRHGSGRPVAGPTLKASLQSVDVSTHPREIIFDIGSPLNYAATVHQGSRPHAIRAASGKPMTFFWHRARFISRTQRLRSDPQVWFWRVQHPGNKRPNRFLATPLHQFGRAANFRVRTDAASRGFLP